MPVFILKRAGQGRERAANFIQCRLAGATSDEQLLPSCPECALNISGVQCAYVPFRPHGGCHTGPEPAYTCTLYLHNTDALAWAGVWRWETEARRAPSPRFDVPSRPPRFSNPGPRPALSLSLPCDRVNHPRRQVEVPPAGCGEQKLRFCRRDCIPPKEGAFEAPFRSGRALCRGGGSSRHPRHSWIHACSISKSSGGANAKYLEAPPVCAWQGPLHPWMSHLFIFGSLSSFEAFRGTTSVQLPSALRLAASLRHLHSRNPSTQIPAFCNLLQCIAASTRPSVSPPS
jgi:hypothetical protein